MRLAPFIREHHKQIIEEWDGFAGTLVPAEQSMSPLATRDHIRELLDFISDDIESPQTGTEQVKKSRGGKIRNSEISVAEIHSSLRQTGGFSMDQMVSEFRALRACVAKLWSAELHEATKAELSDLIRFDEVIDQTLTESISYYSNKLDHSRDLFLGILGHDLRNPIGAIQMAARLTAHVGALNERQTMLISQVITSSGRANDIIDRLLDFTRARLGPSLNIIKEHMDMAFVSRLLVEEMRALHPGRTFTLEISGDTEGEWDKPRIGQVFSNLLGNAVQYGFPGLPVGVVVRGDSKEVSLSVHNDGPPIPTDAIAEIFDPLTSGRASGGADTRSNNLGLGLYITREIVSAHGGNVAVTSSEKAGTTFVVRLPRPQNLSVLLPPSEMSALTVVDTSDDTRGRLGIH